MIDDELQIIVVFNNMNNKKKLNRLIPTSSCTLSKLQKHSKPFKHETSG